MKKYLFFAVALLLFSCSDDDNNNVDNGLHNPYTGSVAGTWKTVALEVDGDPVDLSCDIEEPAEENLLFVFHEDNTFDAYHNCFLEGDVYASGTYTTTGNVLTINMNGLTGKAHMVDHLDENILEFRFTIGDDGLFYNHYFFVEAQP